MNSEKDYMPAGCEHRLKNGFSAFECQSESSGWGPDFNFRVATMVCLECGDIRIAGQRDGRGFDETINIHNPEALAAIIKQANWLNERTVFVPSELLDDKDAEIARLKSLIPIARQIGYNEGILGDNAKPDTDWERFIKENKL